MDLNEIGDGVCQYCIEVMKTGVDVLGISYGLLNVLLFIVLQPLCIILFFATSILYKYGKRNQWLQIVSNTLFIIACLLILVEIGVVLYCMKLTT